MGKIKNLLKEKDLNSARKEVRQDQEKYRNEIKDLISNRQIEGIIFGRCYLDDEEIYNMLYQLIDDDQLDLLIRIQALYEILTEDSTAEEQKEKWFRYLLSDIDKFAEICTKCYSIKEDYNKEKYFGNLKEKKILDTPVNKKWVYLIELIALFREKTEIREIIRRYSGGNNNDAFLKKVAEECLRYLEAR